MLESVCTKDGGFNADEVYEVDKETGNEWIAIGYAIKVNSRESATNAPAKRKATRKRATKR